MSGIRASVHSQISRARLRLAAIALLALAAALAAISLGGAQTMQDSGSQSGQTVSGQIVARVNPPAARSDGAYRMEFGFVTQAMINAAGSVSAAIAANNDLLPAGRFMTEANWLRRAQARNRAWAASSLVRIPTAASGGGQTELQGRVIARWNPKSGGPFRVEFGFLPEWAIAAASSPGDSFSQRVQKAAAQHAVLPRTRYLSENRIATDSRRSSPLWRPSSAVQVPLRNVTPPNGLEVRVTCPTGEVSARAQLTCQVAAGGGTPPYAYSWSAPGAVPPVGSGQTWNPSFSNAGAHRVQVTVTDSARQRADDSTSVTIIPPPTVEAFCTPEEVDAEDTVTCWAQASGGTPPYTYSWSARGASPSSDAGPSMVVWHTRFASGGSYTVQVTVTDSAREQADASASVTVRQPPPILQVECTPEEVEAGELVTCWATVSGGAPPYTNYSWSARGASPSSDAGPSMVVWHTRFASGGSYSVQATVTDRAGASAEDDERIEVTGDPLTVTASCRPTMIDEGDSTSCSATARGGAGGYTFQWRSGSANPSSDSGQSYRPRFDREGNYTVRVTVTDRYRASADDDERIRVTGTGGDPPIVTASCSPRTVDAGDRATCSAETTGGTPPYTYLWTAGGRPVGQGESFRATYQATTELRVTVVDSRREQASDTARVTVRVVDPPSVRITCPPKFVEGYSKECQARASGGTRPYTYSWSASGASPSSGSGERFSTSFSSDGRGYTVRVTVTDSSRQSDSDTATVEVLEPPYIYHYARCGSGKVYYFDRDAPRKHHVAMPWETAQGVFPGWGESWIGVLSATSCARWPDGTDILSSADACRLGAPGANCR